MQRARENYGAPQRIRAWVLAVLARARLWLLAFAQQHLSRPPGARGRALARSAFAAFVIQGPIILGLQVALRRFGAPAEVKTLIVACAAVTGSFALAWLLVSRTPARRIL